MEQLDNLIYDTISTLRSNKKQPNENAIYSLISSKLESLSKDQLEERLSYLVNEEKLKNKPHNGKSSYYLETNRTNFLSSIETPIQYGPLKTPTETAGSTLPSKETPLSPESTTTPMLNNLQRFTNENALLKEQIQNLAAEIEAVKMFMKEQLFLLKKAQKGKSDEEGHSNENSELVKLLRQQNASLLNENASKNEIIKILSENLSIVNKNMCDINSKPEEKYQTVKRKSVTKSNEKLRAEISCKNRYETLYLTDSDDANITEDTGNKSSIDDDCCLDKKKRMRKRKKLTPRNKYPEPVTYHEHPISISNAVGNNENLFQQTRNTFEKIETSYSNIVKQNPKNVVIFTDSMLKSLRMKEFNKNLNGGIAHLKPFPGSKAKQMDHHAIPILKEHQYDAAVIHVGINDLLKSRTNINVSEIAKDIIDIALRCRSHNIATIFISSIVYSTKISHMKIQKLNGLLLNECTKYGFHLVDNGAVSKENLWRDGVHLVESGKVIIANNFLNCINNFLGVANSVLRTR